MHTIRIEDLSGLLKMCEKNGSDPTRSFTLQVQTFLQSELGSFPLLNLFYTQKAAFIPKEVVVSKHFWEFTPPPILPSPPPPPPPQPPPP